MKHNLNIGDSIKDVNIGDIMYKVEDPYDTSYRVTNLYDQYGCELRPSTDMDDTNAFYVGVETLVDEYIKIEPHGYLELTGVRMVRGNYRDLRVAIYNNDINNNAIDLISVGLLLTEVSSDDIGNLECAYMSTVNSEWNNIHAPMMKDYYDPSLVRRIGGHRVAISYYYGDTVETLLSFMDEILSKYLNIIYNGYEDMMRGRNRPNIAVKHRMGPAEMLELNYSILYLLECKGVIYVPIDSLQEIEIAKDNMFVQSDVIDSLRSIIDFPGFPYFVTPYKIHIDLDNIANYHELICVENEKGDIIVFVIMTYLASYEGTSSYNISVNDTGW